MRHNDSATTPVGIAVPHSGPSRAEEGARQESGLGPPGPAAPRAAGRGLLLAALGVTCFSLTFPATAWTLEGFGPWSATFLRLLLAALLAAVLVAVFRVPVPARRHWPWLAVAASGVMVGFPLLTTLALQTSSTAHAAVVVGLLPLTTALYSSLRTGARPSRVFWAAALTGAAAVLAFALHESGGAPAIGDLFLGVALLLCAAGYAEGARLVGQLSGTQVVCWALVGCLPLAVPGTAAALALEPSAGPTAHSVMGLLWVAAGSQLLGLTLWYRGMSVAGVARASQTQLAQPLLTLGWSVLLLGEELSPAAPLTAVAVLVCIAVVRRSRT